jgi:isoamylase
MTDTDPRGQRVVDDSFLLYFNAHDQPIDFRLLKADYGQSWQVTLDTAQPDPATSAVIEAEAVLTVSPRSLVVLQALD